MSKVMNKGKCFLTKCYQKNFEISTSTMNKAKAPRSVFYSFFSKLIWKMIEKNRPIKMVSSTLLKDHITKLKKLTVYKILTVFNELHKLFQFPNFIMNIVFQPEYSFCKIFCLCLYVIYNLCLSVWIY